MQQEMTLADSPGEFAQQVRSLREAQGLSLRALASLIGVSSVTVWKWENGDSKPRARLITPLAHALEVAPRQLKLATGGVAASTATPEQGASGKDEVARIGQGDFGPTDEEAGNQGEVLADVIARAKQMIADASGTASNNITIRIEC
jgi:transcriptional regulator with XRE-family HTH domain